jgi:hypothetical protein
MRAPKAAHAVPGRAELAQSSTSRREAMWCVHETRGRSVVHGNQRVPTPPARPNDLDELGECAVKVRAHPLALMRGEALRATLARAHKATSANERSVDIIGHRVAA